MSFRTSPDYEDRRDANGDNTYEVTVTASDGTLTSPLGVKVMVTNVNEPHEIAGRDDIDHFENDSGAVAAALNSRPRKTLDWKTPAETLNEHLHSLKQGSVATTL